MNETRFMRHGFWSEKGVIINIILQMYIELWMICLKLNSVYIHTISNIFSQHYSYCPIYSYFRLPSHHHPILVCFSLFSTTSSPLQRQDTFGKEICHDIKVSFRLDFSFSHSINFWCLERKWVDNLEGVNLTIRYILKCKRKKKSNSCTEEIWFFFYSITFHSDN